MMRVVFAALVVALVSASQMEYFDLAAEIPAPPGESNDNVQELIQESAGTAMGADVVYRISWNTQYDNDPSKTASKGTFKINIKGDDSETGSQTLITHPGYSCGAASDPECFPDITGKVLADDDASAKCACDPVKAGYDEKAAKWRPFAGTVQHFFLKGTDVGEVKEVVVEGDAAASDSWTPGFLKINMNDMETGVGNGIYYMDIGKKINKDKPLTLKAGATDAYGEAIKMEKQSSHKYGIIKCEAGACMKKMEKMMAAASQAAKK
jgi:hypothetical protein